MSDHQNTRISTDINEAWFAAHVANGHHDGKCEECDAATVAVEARGGFYCSEDCAAEADGDCYGWPDREDFHADG